MQTAELHLAIDHVVMAKLYGHQDIKNMARTIANSIIVMFGATGLALAIGFVLALGLARVRIYGARILFLLLGGFFFVPLYVQAGAWNAGFGMLGWWTLSQVSGAREPLRGIQAVVWIHAMASVPAVVLILLCGFNRTSRSREDIAVSEGGARRVLWQVWIRGNANWIAAACLWCLATIGNDMLVTNLYQVRTTAEQFYLDITIGQFSWYRAVVACIPSLIIAGLFAAWSLFAWHGSSTERLTASQRTWFSASWQTVIWTVSCWTLVSVAIILPLANLIIKAGWDATRVGDRIERRWLFSRLANATLRAPVDYQPELVWSLQIAGYAALTSIVLSLIAARWFTHATWWRTIGMALGCFAIAMPGPAINVMLTALFIGTAIPSFGDLYDRTLIPTVLAVLFRTAPIAVLMIGLSWSRWYQIHRDVLMIDGHVRWHALLARYLRSNWGLVVVTGVWLFAIAFADFASFSQLLPPSVTPISKRIFELLHYGVRYQEAGLCLFLAICGMMIGGATLSRFSEFRYRR